MVSKKVKYIIDNYASLSGSNLSPNSTNLSSGQQFKTIDESYDVVIFRLNDNDISIFKKKIITDKDFFNDLIKSITYDDSKLEDDLNHLLISLRSKKIDRLTDKE